MGPFKTPMDRHWHRQVKDPLAQMRERLEAQRAAAPKYQARRRRLGRCEQWLRSTPVGGSNLVKTRDFTRSKPKAGRVLECFIPLPAVFCKGGLGGCINVLAFAFLHTCGMLR